MADVDWREGKITDAGIAEMRDQIGVKGPVPGWNTTVSEDGIWHFALGIGDDNPLWWDADYAAKSSWGGRIAPPSYLYSHTSGPRLTPEAGKMIVEMFLPGVLGLWAGERWRWTRPARVGERITTESALVDVQVNESGRFGGRSVAHTEHLELKTDSGELVAEVFRTIKRFERGEAVSRSSYLDRPIAFYTAADRERIDRHYASEAASLRRGSEPRYVEDVRIGDALGPMLKGPLTVSNIIGFLLGWGTGLAATNRIHSHHLELHPETKMVHPETGIAENFEAPHWEPAFAKASGLPGAYDFGCQRFSWFTHLLTDWAGDDGFLSELDFRLKRPNIVGDVTWLSGEVIEVNPSTRTVRISVTAVNQLNETTATGVGTIILPSRSDA